LLFASKLRFFCFKTSPTNKQNNTILDLDQLQLSDSKSFAETSNKHIDTSLLDDIQIFTKNTANLKFQTSTKSLSKASTPDEANSQPITNGLVNGHINVNGDDSSALIAKLINENKALKEKEKASQAQIQSLEDENEKFK